MSLVGCLELNDNCAAPNSACADKQVSEGNLTSSKRAVNTMTAVRVVNESIKNEMVNRGGRIWSACECRYEPQIAGITVLLRLTKLYISNQGGLWVLVARLASN